MTKCHSPCRSSLSGLPVTTSTLAMGVNLPAHLVVVKSTMHYVSGSCEEYSEADMLQMIGRAGRPQVERLDRDPHKSFKPSSMILICIVLWLWRQNNTCFQPVAKDFTFWQLKDSGLIKPLHNRPIIPLMKFKRKHSKRKRWILLCIIIHKTKNNYNVMSWWVAYPLTPKCCCENKKSLCYS